MKAVVLTLAVSIILIGFGLLCSAAALSAVGGGTSPAVAVCAALAFWLLAGAIFSCLAIALLREIWEES